MDENENKTTNEEKVQEQQNAEPVTQDTAATEVPKETFGQKLKKHRKGLAVAGAAIAAVVGSAIAAYRKGKAARYDPVGDDGAVDPNE